MNARKLSPVSGLLRNSTIFAAQKLGFEQCSQKAPKENSELKLRPDCHWPCPSHWELQALYTEVQLIASLSQPDNKRLQVVPGFAPGEALDTTVHRSGLLQQ